MKEITKEVFDSNPHMAPQSGPFTEKQWFSHRALLGAVLFDHDGEWAWVVLAKHDDGLFRGIDMGVSLKTKEDAVGALERSLTEHEATEQAAHDPPVTKEEALGIMSDVTGTPVERLSRGLDDFVKNPKSGNN